MPTGLDAARLKSAFSELSEDSLASKLGRGQTWSSMDRQLGGMVDSGILAFRLGGNWFSGSEFLAKDPCQPVLGLFENVSGFGRGPG